MSAEITVSLDRATGIVEQRVDGPIEMDDYRRLLSMTEACVAQLPEGSMVRILADGRTMGRPTSDVRRMCLAQFRRPEFHRMAIWGAPPVARFLARFISISVGRDLVRAFGSRNEAQRWLHM